MKNLMPIFLFLFSGSLGAQTSELEIYSQELHFSKHTEMLKDEFYKLEVYHKSNLEDDYVFMYENFNSGNFHIQQMFFGYYFISLKAEGVCYKYIVSIEVGSEGHGMRFGELDCGGWSIEIVNEKEKLQRMKSKL